MSKQLTFVALLAILSLSRPANAWVMGRDGSAGSFGTQAYTTKLPLGTVSGGYGAATAYGAADSVGGYGAHPSSGYGSIGRPLGRYGDYGSLFTSNHGVPRPSSPGDYLVAAIAKVAHNRGLPGPGGFFGRYQPCPARCQPGYNCAAGCAPAEEPCPVNCIPGENCDLRCSRPSTDGPDCNDFAMPGSCPNPSNGCDPGCIPGATCPAYCAPSPTNPCPNGCTPGLTCSYDCYNVCYAGCTPSLNCPSWCPAVYVPCPFGCFPGVTCASTCAITNRVIVR